jgi:hypothetical protein
MRYGLFKSGAVAIAVLLPMGTGATSPTPPDVRKLAVAPREGATGVPTNARLFVDDEHVLRATLLESPAGQTPVSHTPYQLLGFPLPGLQPDTDYTVELSDGERKRRLGFRTGAGEDHMPPTLTGEPHVEVCSFFTECGNGKQAPALEHAETFRVTVTVPRAEDDTGIALYMLRETMQDGTTRPYGLLQQSTREGGSQFPQWQEEPGTGEAVTLLSFAELPEGREEEVLVLQVLAVDLAGNVSEPSQPLKVLLKRSPPPPAWHTLPGCTSGVGGPVLQGLGMLGLALLLRGRRGRSNV